MGEEYADLALYFDQCRMKRNVGTYDRGGQISASEVDERLTEVRAFQEDVIDWLKRTHPNLIKHPMVRSDVGYVMARYPFRSSLDFERKILLR